MHQLFYVGERVVREVDTNYRVQQGSPDTTIAIPNPPESNEPTESSIKRALKKAIEWFRPINRTKYPESLYLLPTLLFLNHLVALGEILSSIWVNSLGVFSHGSHMIFNTIILTGLITSVLIYWKENGRCSMVYFDLVLRANLFLGILFLANGLIMAYISIRHTFNPPEIRYESLFFLVPLPALPLNFVGVYVLVNGDDGPMEDDELDALLRGRFVLRFEVIGSIYRHMLINSFGCVGTIISTICVQIFGWTIADSIGAGFNSTLMIACAVGLMKESIDYIVKKRKSQVFSVTHYVKNEIHHLANIFTV